MIGLLLGLLGIAFIFYKDSLLVHGTHYILGVGLSLFAMITWSVGSIIISRNKINMNAYYSIGWQMLISAITMGLFTLITGKYECLLLDWMANAHQRHYNGFVYFIYR